MIVADPMMAQLSDFLRSAVSGEVTWLFHDQLWNVRDQSVEAKLCGLLGDVDVYVGGQFTKAMVEAAPSLRLIQLPGTGSDHVDLEALRPGVIVANTYNHQRSIAEYVLMAMLALSRQLLLSDAHLRQAAWDSPYFNSAVTLHRTLRGRTVGLVGFGHIGAEVARLAGCFEMRAAAIKRSVDADLAAQYGLDFIGGPADLPKLLRYSDFVVLAAPLTEKTRGMIGPDELALMQPTACLINVARAVLVDEAALYEALAERRIAGAALDVWYTYPTADVPTMPASYPFHQLDNVILTPHNSGITHETYRYRARDVAANIDRLSNGRPLVNVVHPRASSV